MNGNRAVRNERITKERENTPKRDFRTRRPLEENKARVFARSGSGEFAAEDFLGPEALRCIRRC